jgi:hypothetical protein
MTGMQSLFLRPLAECFQLDSGAIVVVGSPGFDQLRGRLSISIETV